MEFLDDVEEARYFIGESKRNEEVENILDPEHIQEVDDCEYEGIIDHPDYPNLDIEALEREVRSKIEKTYRTIDLDNLQDLLEKTKKLDYFQRKVVEVGIKYSRQLVKALKTKKFSSNSTKINDTRWSRCWQICCD